MTAVSSIKNNAVLSIRLAVEDYKTGDPVRTISALRNITAGILLLYKEKLLRLSPPDLERLNHQLGAVLVVLGRVRWHLARAAHPLHIIHPRNPLHIRRQGRL